MNAAAHLHMKLWRQKVNFLRTISELYSEELLNIALIRNCYLPISTQMQFLRMDLSFELCKGGNRYRISSEICLVWITGDKPK